MTLKKIIEKYKLPIKIETPKGCLDFIIKKDRRNKDKLIVEYLSGPVMDHELLVDGMDHINHYEVVSHGGLM